MSKSFAARYFAKIKALNELIDKGGEVAKEAGLAKSCLATSTQLKPNANQNKKRKKVDMLDSRAMLSGSFGSGKRK